MSTEKWKIVAVRREPYSSLRHLGVWRWWIFPPDDRPAPGYPAGGMRAPEVGGRFGYPFTSWVAAFENLDGYLRRNP